MTPVLVTGGAGYVGSHASMRLAAAGYLPIAYDDLSNGHAAFAQWGPLEVGDIRDGDRLAYVLRRYRPRAVLHFAGLIEVGDSMKRPELYRDVNVAGSLTLIDRARRAGVQNLVFSSSCATYGAPEFLPMTEDHPQRPVSPYGDTKLAIEEALGEIDQDSGFRSIVLRYFNAAGADPEGRVGEAHSPETHALPLAILAALGERPGFTVFGDDYETRDGTALRDYVHVLDLADAHVLALRRLLDGGAGDVFNLGNGVGVTVKEMLAAVRAVNGRDFAIETAGRRPGDAPALVADSRKALTGLGWRPRHGFQSIVETAWRWHSKGHSAARTTFEPEVKLQR
jgi:UDP-glucose 4-epimerase